ncbi:hypothetical protein [robinz microvirus RP_152]|nr:hypothetical protein [robinz microvirus RP_152]
MRRSRSDRLDRRPAGDPFLDNILDPVTTFNYLDHVVRAVDDRRFFDPAGPLRPAYSFGRDARRLIAKSSPVGRTRNDTLSARVGFAVPERVAVCVRRKQRKEVIHALDRAGGGGSRRRRRNRYSDVDC